MLYWFPCVQRTTPCLGNSRHLGRQAIRVRWEGVVTGAVHGEVNIQTGMHVEVDYLKIHPVGTWDQG